MTGAGDGVAVVIPSFRAGATIGNVIRKIGPEVDAIYLVDDGCPDGSGDRALVECSDERLVVLRNERNLGVGGAMKEGYKRALRDGAGIVVKLDADGQMDPDHIRYLLAPLLAGRADYAKGDRFAPQRRMPLGSCPNALRTMPPARRLANRLLRLLHGLATGYWDVRDPANGFTAIRADMLARLGKDCLADCFFFETDMLFRLQLAGAAVVEVPLPARYEGASTFRLRRVALRFALLVTHRALQRLAASIRRGVDRSVAGSPSPEAR